MLTLSPRPLRSLRANIIGDQGAIALVAILKETKITDLKCAAAPEHPCQWALTEKRTLQGAAAHLSLVIFVSLTMAASAVAPLALMLLPPRLKARVRVGTLREQACQRALTANSWKLVRAPRGLLELSQCRVALQALGKSSYCFRTKKVVSQTVSTGA